MILYYAMGGGLGHLVRARAVLHALGIEARAALLTASPHARDRRVVGDLPVHIAPALRDPAGSADREAHREWLAGVLRRLEPEEIFVDTFPVGLLGELSDRSCVTGARLVYVGRLLRWPAYTRAFPDAGRAHFARGYFVEPLHADHDAAMRARCEQVVALQPRDPPADGEARGDGTGAALATIARDLPARYWLVVHSGPPEEIAELVAYARDLQRIEADRAPIVVASPHAAPAGDGLIAIDLHPATSLFAHAARVVSACGYNVMRQMAPYAERHRFLPLPRRYDDQFERAARRREAARAGVR